MFKKISLFSENNGNKDGRYQEIRNFGFVIEHTFSFLNQLSVLSRLLSVLAIFVPIAFIYYSVLFSFDFDRPLAMSNSKTMRSVEIETTRPMVPNLPEEVLSKLFSYLPLEDRKNVRLSCRRFYEACNTILIQENENFLFCGNINTEAAILSLSHSESRLWNIQLYHVHLMNDSIFPFFEKQGANIRSLTLESCEIGPGILKGLIKSCITLRSVKFILGLVEVVAREQIAFFNEFKALENDGIVCPNVTDFSLQTTSLSTAMTNEIFLRFFTIFPNIIKLDIEVINQFSTISSEITSQVVFSFSSVYYQIFDMRRQLRELKLNFITFDDDDPSISIQILSNISSIEIKNLNKLSLNCVIDLCTVPSSIIDSVVQLKHLTEIDYFFTEEVSRSISGSGLIEYILNTATELRSLIIRKPAFNFELCINENCFKALVRSQLVKLDLMVIIKINFQNSTLNKYRLPKNCTLKYLHFDTIDNFIILLFAKYFISLESLVFPQVQGNTPSFIYKYQIKLFKLNLYNCDETYRCSVKVLSKQWTTHKGDHHQLEYLTHLKLTETKTLDLSQFFLSKRSLPNLKSLFLHMKDSYLTDDAYNFDLISQNIQELTQLEYLNIMWEWEGIISFYHCLALCSALQKLRYFLLSTPRSLFFEDSEYRQLFQTQPSLRIIVHRERQKR